MLLLPFLLGLFLGEPSWLHVPLFIGWLALYLATYPMLMLLKKKQVKLYRVWFIRYVAVALCFLIIPILIKPNLALFGFMMIPFFLINVYFSKQNNERALMNDISAISVFSIGGLASYYVGTTSISFLGFMIYGLSLFFFIGSTFFVKSLIRERKNKRFRFYSYGYHVALIILLVLTDYAILAIAFVPSLIRAFMFYNKPVTPKKIGILEIGNSVYFLMSVIILIKIGMLI